MERLPAIRRLSYGVGHVLNDMCASMWFSYLLLYFQSVNLFSNSLAGFVLLLGQIADAIATPLIGYESDHQDGCCGYGKRKSWHLLGTACVAVSFPFIFTRCIGCADSADWAQFVYYAPFVVLFQFGWASTQISHLSLIPELASENSDRVELNAIRYGFTVTSNIAVYGLTWLLLKTRETDPSGKVCPDDALKFRTLVLVVVGTGLLFSVVFHLGTKEGRSSRELSSGQTCGRVVTWHDWLKEYQFYLMAALYMCTRLIVNLSQIYMPMYVMHSLQLPKTYVALIPLVVYISGFVTSFLMRPLNCVLRRKGTYLVGVLLVGVACAWMMFIPLHAQYQTIGAAVILGFGTSTILVTSLAMTAELIGDNVNSGAFVYGAMSFTDKLSNGAAVMLIQVFHPCNALETNCCAACVWYYRNAIVYIPGAVAGAALLVLGLMTPITIGKLKQTYPNPACTSCNVINDADQDDADTNDEDVTRPLLARCISAPDP